MMKPSSVAAIVGPTGSHAIGAGVSEILTPPGRLRDLPRISRSPLSGVR
jgi:hypothetical protein